MGRSFDAATLAVTYKTAAFLRYAAFTFAIIYLFDMKYFLLVIALFLCMFSCKNDENNDTGTGAAEADTALHYPISQYINSQTAYVDTQMLAIEKLTYENNVLIDSQVIDRPTFNAMAKDFAEPDINLDALRKKYHEEKFQDETIHTLTFTYKATDPDLPLQETTILLVPETQQVKTVLMKKVEKYDDSTVVKNMLWKHNYHFQIGYIVRKEGQPDKTRTVRVVWDKQRSTYE